MSLSYMFQMLNKALQQSGTNPIQINKSDATWMKLHRTELPVEPDEEITITLNSSDDSIE